MTGATYASLFCMALWDARERAFWATARFPKPDKTKQCAYTVVDSKDGQVRLSHNGDMFTVDEVDWENYLASFGETDSPWDRCGVYDAHLKGRHAVNPDRAPKAGVYREIMERGKAVLLVREEDGARYWCPTSVWEGWIAGDKKAVRWFLDRADQTSYRPRWDVKQKGIKAVALGSE